MSNANFPKDSENRVHHLGIKEGELANYIVTVGDVSRAFVIAKFLDNCNEVSLTPNFKNEHVSVITSKRNFTTVTGKYRGKAVSIVAIGMGMPMMDFFVREARAVVSGPMFIIRFGSCGAIGKASVGDVIVAEDSVACRRDFDVTYSISKVSKSDMELTSALTQELKKQVPVVQGRDVTADSFYSSQGRIDPMFNDNNLDLIDRLAGLNAESLQMETFQLFHLAECGNEIRAAAFAMVFADRAKNKWIDEQTISFLEPKCAKSVLETLIKFNKD